MKIPFNNLVKQWQDIAPSIKNDINNIIDNTSFIDSSIITQFENKLKQLHCVNNAIGVSDGTAALYLLLRAYNIGIGDEIIFPSNTFIATAFAISLTGATPIPCDVGHDGLISLKYIQERLTVKTKAIIVVHLFGCAVNLSLIKEHCDKNNILLFEDAAQSIGNKNADMGKTTHGASLSFYPGKNLGAFGQAGGILINDNEKSNKIRRILSQGQKEKYIHSDKGGNFRLDSIQAVPLNYGIDKIIEWNQFRIKAGEYYNTLLPNELLLNFNSNKSIYHIYPIILPTKTNRKKIIDKLNNIGISTGIHYPIPVHKSEAYLELAHFKCKNSEYLCDRILSLPIFTSITKEEVKYVSDCLLNNL